MDAIQLLPWNAQLPAYVAQADVVSKAYRAGSTEALEFFRQHHPSFRDPDVVWRPRETEQREIVDAALTLNDARMAIARAYCFRDWSALTQWVTAVADSTSPTFAFESAVEAVIAGDATALQQALNARPELVHARSERVTPHDPGVHGATLLHYLAANGVEDQRQHSPPNAVAIARILLAAGADADALAEMYGEQCTTLSMLVSSTPPAQEGVQVALTHILIDFGADPEGAGTGNWTSPLLTALIFGFHDAAHALVARGAVVDTLTKAAGLGHDDRMLELLPHSSAHDRHAALALAASNGHAHVVRLLVESGEDPNRCSPDGFHAHSTPLHQAACAGHLAVVETLVSLGARTDLLDTLWEGNALGWAEHCNQPAVAAFLRTLTKS